METQHYANSRLQPGYWLAIDQGTTSTRAILFDQDGQTVASARRPVDIQRGPAAGHVEQDAAQIANSVDEVLQEIARTIAGTVDSTQGTGKVLGVGLATQRSSVVAWDRLTGRPLSRVLSWQDTRCRDAIDAMHDQAAEIHKRTGLPLTPHYGASKIGWLLRTDHDTAGEIAVAAREGRLTIGPLSSFVMQSMLEHTVGTPRTALVDHANGGRTQLMNIATGDWDERLLSQFDIPRQVLPGIRPTEFDYGQLRRVNANLLVAQGDQTAAVFGQGGLDEEMAHVNLGTGGFILTTAQNHQSAPRLLRSIARSRYTSEQTSARKTEITYIREGTVNGCGSAIDWAAEQRGLTVNDANFRRWLSADRAESIRDGSDTVPIFLNTIGGLGSPFWKSGPPANWTKPPTNDDIAMLAVVESILFLVLANVREMQTNDVVQRLRVTGGLCASDSLCQRLSDITGLPVFRPPALEATSRGAAWLAANRPAQWLTGKTQSWSPQSDEYTKASCKRGEKFLQLVREGEKTPPRNDSTIPPTSSQP